MSEIIRVDLTKTVIDQDFLAVGQADNEGKVVYALKYQRPAILKKEEESSNGST